MLRLPFVSGALIFYLNHSHKPFQRLISCRADHSIVERRSFEVTKTHTYYSQVNAIIPLTNFDTIGLHNKERIALCVFLWLEGMPARHSKCYSDLQLLMSGIMAMVFKILKVAKQCFSISCHHLSHILNITQDSCFFPDYGG